MRWCDSYREFRALEKLREKISAGMTTSREERESRKQQQTYQSLGNDGDQQKMERQCKEGY